VVDSVEDISTVLNRRVVVLDLLDGRLMNGVGSLMWGELMIQRDGLAGQVRVGVDRKFLILSVDLEIFKIDHGKSSFIFLSPLN
jgi:hypothetical protein